VTDDDRWGCAPTKRIKAPPEFCYACGKRQAVWQCEYCLLILCEVHACCPECGEDVTGCDPDCNAD
jgi:hypothetical protein